MVNFYTLAQAEREREMSYMTNGDTPHIGSFLKMAHIAFIVIAK